MKPRLIIVAGANGAGKSTLTARLKRRFGARLGTILDPDAIARERTPDNPGQSAIFAARTVLTALADGLERGSRMVYETTLSDKNRHLELISAAKAKGFEVWVLYVGLDVADMHIRRVRSRARSGGHDVPDAHIVRRYSRSLRNLETVLSLADRVLIYDNSGRTMQRAASILAGRLRRVSGSGWWLPFVEGLSA